MAVHLLDPSQLEADGEAWVSPWLAVDLPARAVVASVSAAGPEAAPLILEVAARTAAGDSAFAPVAAWGPGAPAEAPPFPEGLRLDGDEVVADPGPLLAARVRVQGARGLRRVGVTFWPSFDKVAVPRRVVAAPALPPRIPQYSVDPEIGGRICGPTCLTMALRARGLEADPLEVAAAVLDPWADLYGNWTRLAAEASFRGLAAWVERGGGPVRLVEHLRRGAFAILSVRWVEGELTGAPIASSAGHLILAVGADAEGVHVLDPAFRDPEVQVVRYPWQDLVRCWKSGAMVVLGGLEDSSRTA